MSLETSGITDFIEVKTNLHVSEFQRTCAVTMIHNQNYIGVNILFIDPSIPKNSPDPLDVKFIFLREFSSFARVGDWVETKNVLGSERTTTSNMDQADPKFDFVKIQGDSFILLCWIIPKAPDSRLGTTENM